MVFPVLVVATKARHRQNKSQCGPRQPPGGPPGDQLRGTLGARLREPFIDFYFGCKGSTLIDPEIII